MFNFFKFFNWVNITVCRLFPNRLHGNQLHFSIVNASTALRSWSRNFLAGAALQGEAPAAPEAIPVAPKGADRAAPKRRFLRHPLKK